MALLIEEIPQKDAFVGARQLLTRAAVDWLLGLVTRVDDTPRQVGRITKDAQAASLPTASAVTETLAAGRYRLSYYLDVVQVPTVSGSVRLGLAWTKDGVAKALLSTLLTATALTDVITGTATVDLDAATALTYSTTYASVGATPFQYTLTIDVEALPS